MHLWVLLCILLSDRELSEVRHYTCVCCLQRDAIHVWTKLDYQQFINNYPKSLSWVINIALSVINIAPKAIYERPHMSRQVVFLTVNQQNSQSTDWTLLFRWPWSRKSRARVPISLRLKPRWRKNTMVRLRDWDIWRRWLLWCYCRRRCCDWWQAGEHN